jgi:hypothetical protein
MARRPQEGWLLILTVIGGVFFAGNSLAMMILGIALIIILATMF